MSVLESLISPAPVTQVNLWATVTSVSPLRVQLEGEPGPLDIAPTSLVAGLVVGDSVRVELTTNTNPARHTRRAVILGRVGGTPAFDPLDGYPVGSIYLSVNSTSPATLFGGTWVRIQDTFLLAAGSTYAAGATGGEATHVLTVAEMPSHNHPSTPGTYIGTGGGTYSVANGTFYGFQDTASSNTGGGGAHNNMPPYVAVYVWKRTA